jgi:hypothetical protein
MVSSALFDLPKKYWRKSDNRQINADVKKRRSFLALLFAAGHFLDA